MQTHFSTSCDHSIGPLEPNDLSAALAAEMRRASSNRSSHSGRGSFLACRSCKTKSEPDEDLMCIKVYCSTIDPHASYRVLRISHTTTAGHVSNHIPSCTCSPIHMHAFFLPSQHQLPFTRRDSFRFCLLSSTPPPKKNKRL